MRIGIQKSLTNLDKNEKPSGVLPEGIQFDLFYITQ